MHGKSLKLVVAIFLIILSLQYNSIAEDIESDEGKKTDDSASVQNAINKDSELLNKLMAQSQYITPDPEIKDVEFDIGGNEIEGSSSAKLIMVQFSDYTCSHCALYTMETYPEILKNYVDTGKLSYVIVDYPLPGNIPATSAAEAVHCASDQGKFREMHEIIMSQRESLGDLNPLASFIDLDMGKFKACMESKKYEAAVNKNIELGMSLKIPSVPNFIIARVDPKNPEKVKGITYIRGAKPYAYFKQEIDKALAEIK